MPSESENASCNTEPLGRFAGAFQRANDCLRMAVEAVAILTEAPLRMNLIEQTDSRQVFEALEEFELGRAGRRFLVSVDPQADRVVVIAAGRPM